MIPIAGIWSFFFDIFFLAGAGALAAWYFLFYRKRDMFGGFLGSLLIASTGGLLIFAVFQKIVRDIVMWMISPKFGSEQISNLNLIAVIAGAFLSLYLVSRIQPRFRKTEQEDTEVKKNEID